MRQWLQPRNSMSTGSSGGSSSCSSAGGVHPAQHVRCAEAKVDTWLPWLWWVLQSCVKTEALFCLRSCCCIRSIVEPVRNLVLGKVRLQPASAASCCHEMRLEVCVHGAFLVTTCWWLAACAANC